MIGTRLPDAVMGEPGPGWDAWEWINPKTGYCECRAPLGAFMKVRSRRDDGQLKRWCWYVRDPLGDICTLFDNHRVDEHADGTITATPSIINPNGSYHGFLQQGVWS